MYGFLKHALRQKVNSAIIRYTYLGRRIPGGHSSAVVKRVVLDAFAFTPVYTPMIMGLLMYLRDPSTNVGIAYVYFYVNLNVNSDCGEVKS